VGVDGSSGDGEGEGEGSALLLDALLFERPCSSDWRRVSRYLSGTPGLGGTCTGVPMPLPRMADCAVSNRLGRRLRPPTSMLVRSGLGETACGPPPDLPHDLRMDLRVPLSVDARGGEPEIGVAGGIGDVEVEVEVECLCPR
jgi:hypothetical protein